jgi:N-acetylneuraminic acid mutarotase
VSIVGERIYLFGGCSYAGSAVPSSGSSSPMAYLDNDMWCLDLRTLTWSVACPGGAASTFAPSRRYAHAAAVVGTTVLVHGGYNTRETYLGDLWAFDTVTCRWREVVPRGMAPTPRYAHAAVSVGGTMWVFGGCAELSCFREMWALDTATATWTKVALRGITPSPRAYHIAAAIGRTIVVFGGRAGATYFNDMFTFDIDSLTWQKVDQRGALPPEIAYHAAAVVAGRLVVFGGQDARSTLYNAVFVFNTATLSWERFDSQAIEGVAPAPRQKHAVCAYGPCLVSICGMAQNPISFSETFVLETTSSPSPASPPPTTTAVASLSPTPTPTPVVSVVTAATVLTPSPQQQTPHPKVSPRATKAEPSPVRSASV